MADLGLLVLTDWSLLMPSATIWMMLDDTNSTLKKIDKSWKGKKTTEDLKDFLNNTFPRLKELPDYNAIYESKRVWTCLTDLDHKRLEIDLYAERQADIFNHASMTFRRLKDIGNYSVDFIEFKPERTTYGRAIRTAVFPQGAALAIIASIASGIGGLPSFGPLVAAGIGAITIVFLYVPVMTYLNMKGPEI
jgi:hypothetical protein